MLCALYARIVKKQNVMDVMTHNTLKVLFLKKQIYIMLLLILQK